LELRHNTRLEEVWDFAEMIRRSGYSPGVRHIGKAQESKANIIGCSALLTTSMPYIRDLIDLLIAVGERPRFK
jgi:hypothetical protein